MPKKIIKIKNAPKKIGPYSQVVSAGGFIYTCGILPLDSVTGDVVGGDINNQTHAVLDNLANVLEECKLKKSDIVKIRVNMTDLSDFADMNALYEKFFEKDFPVRVTMQVSALPRGVKIQIEAIMHSK